MKSQEIAYIIPGYLFSPNQAQYKQIAGYFKARSIVPISVTIQWKEKTIMESVTDFLEWDSQNQATKRYILGFSFGAIIALIASTKITVDTLILCSLSPFFQEDLLVVPSSFTHDLDAKQVEEFKKMNNRELVKKITANTFVLYGLKEGEFVEKRAKSTFENLSAKKHLIAIDGVKHDIADKNYQKIIEGIIKKL